MVQYCTVANFSKIFLFRRAYFWLLSVVTFWSLTFWAIVIEWKWWSEWVDGITCCAFCFTWKYKWAEIISGKQVGNYDIDVIRDGTHRLQDVVVLVVRVYVHLSLNVFKTEGLTCRFILWKEHGKYVTLKLFDSFSHLFWLQRSLLIFNDLP